MRKIFIAIFLITITSLAFGQRKVIQNLGNKRVEVNNPGDFSIDSSLFLFKQKNNLSGKVLTTDSAGKVTLVDDKQIDSLAFHVIDSVGKSSVMYANLKGDTVVIELQTNVTESALLLRPYKSYTALLTQTGTSIPTVTVLENSIGTISWSRNNVGDYLVTSANLFSANKTVSIIGVNDMNPVIIYSTNVLNTNQIKITTKDKDGILQDGKMTNLFFEIRVYN